MRSALMILTSVAMAIIMGGLLLSAGVLRVKPGLVPSILTLDGKADRLKETGSGLTANLSDAIDSAKTVVSGVLREKHDRDTSEKETEEYTPGETGAETMEDSGPAAREKEPASRDGKGSGLSERQKRILLYLSSTDRGRGDLERRFREFLLKDLGLSANDSDRIMKMAFWKGFVTLQERWRSESADEFIRAFRWEKRLKKAGFEALGLQLLEQPLSRAEAEAERHFFALKKSEEKKI